MTYPKNTIECLLSLDKELYSTTEGVVMVISIQFRNIKHEEYYLLKYSSNFNENTLIKINTQKAFQLVRSKH